MSNREYQVVDVFSEQPLKGNPVAVFTDAQGLLAHEMQAIAQELNLSETTFILPPKNGGDIEVRIFTPVNELPFAGHPTLGTAFVVGSYIQKNNIIMETKMGSIPFTLDRDDHGNVIFAEMKQPIPKVADYEFTDTVLKALAIESSTLPIDIYYNGPRHVFVGLDSLEALSALQPDLNILSTLEDVAINCFARRGDEWQMRMFSPAYGVAEDAATGSAAGPLALHLARYKVIGFNKAIHIWQGVEMGRHSVMHATVRGDDTNIDSICVSGSAILIAKGNFYY